jgi:hypothetical protein
MRWRLLLGSLFLAAAVAAQSDVQEGVPALLVQTGRLLGPDDKAFTGELTVRIRIYRLSAPPPIGSNEADDVYFDETYSVAVFEGLYTVEIGSTVGGKQALDLATLAGGLRFIGVTLGTDPEMSPRLRLGAVPYAHHAARATRAATAGEAEHAAAADTATSAADAAKLGGEPGSYYTDASHLTGTVADARLSSNVAMLAGEQTFSGAKTFGAGAAFGGATTFLAPPAFAANSGAPFSVGSDAVVEDLNADLLDGIDSTKFMRTDGDSSTTGTVTAAAFVGDGSGLTGLTSGDATKLPLAGGTLSGTLTLNPSSGAALLAPAGNVGIGVSAPAARLHVGGGVQIGDDSDNCVPARAGSLRYRNGTFEGCDGAGWFALAARTPDGSAQDRAAPSCKVLKTSYPSLADATYWIDPDGAGGTAAFQAFCDMAGGGWTRVLFEDYSSAVSGWSNDTITTCGAYGEILGGYNVLGGVTITKMVSLLGVAHTEVRLKFTYLFIDSWDGESGYADLAGTRVWTQARGNCCPGPGSDVCGNTGHYDQSFNLDYSVSHTAASAQVLFGSTINQSPDDESFAVDNVAVFVR